MVVCVLPVRILASDKTMDNAQWTIDNEKQGPVSIRSQIMNSE
jgi:hypothetical protein